MIAAADFVGYLLSAGGVIACFLAAAVWSTIRTRGASRAPLIVALVFAVIASATTERIIARAIAGPARPFKATDIGSGRRTAVVLLGSNSIDTRDWNGDRFATVDRVAASRMLEAARVFKLVDPAVVISSGGIPHGRRATPSGVTMRDALMESGVPFGRIAVETSSMTTRDEAVIVPGMLRDLRIEQTILVTSPTHMTRAVGAFRATGVEVVPAIANAAPFDGPLIEQIVPTDDGLRLAAGNAREILGLTYYWLRGWWSSRVVLRENEIDR